MDAFWPFYPNTSVIEAISWNTDLMTSREQEQRHARRWLPRIELQYRHALSDADLTLARAIVRGVGAAGDWNFPDWTRGTRGPVFEGAEVEVPDGPVIVWWGPERYEFSEVQGGVLGPCTPSGNARVAPVCIALMTSDLQVSRRPGGWGKVGVAFTYQAEADPAGEMAAPEYAGRPVLLRPLQIGGETAAEGESFAEYVTDNGLSFPVKTPERGFPHSRFFLRMWGRDLAAERAFLWRLRGRWGEFWLPEWWKESSVISLSGTTLSLSRFDPSEKYVALLSSEGWEFRRVLLAEEGVLTLDQAPASSGGITRAVALRRCRLDTDRLEFVYSAGAGVTFSAPCVQLHGSI